MSNVPAALALPRTSNGAVHAPRSTVRSVVRLVAAAVARPFLVIGRMIHDSRTRQAERHVARILAQSGGRLTDDIERRLMRQFLEPDGSHDRRGG